MSSLCKNSPEWSSSGCNFGPCRCNLQKITGENGISARYLARWGTNLLRRPLGCTFDKVKGYLIIADHGNNQVRALDTEVFQEAFSVCGVYRPGGVVQFEGGRTFGMVDDRYVSVFDFRSLDSNLVSERFNGNHRGLCVTSCGNYLVTLKRNYSMPPNVLLYDIRSTGEPAESFEYDIDSLTRGSSPSFMDCWQNLFVISDLGIRAVYTLTYSLKSKENDGASHMTPHSWLSIDSKDFVYPAGVCFDSHGEVILSDAGASKLYWFDSNSNFRGEVVATDGYCYGSGICLSSEGHLMVCGRRSNEVKFYQLEPV